MTEGADDSSRSTGESSPAAPVRRPATVDEAKALAHPLRLRILRLCAFNDLTNKQLADRLEHDPGTVLYHVRQLVKTGFLEQISVRTGESGALEKPYRSTNRSWWLSTSLDEAGSDAQLAPLEAFSDELREAGPESIQTFSRFTLHLSPDDAEELDRRILAVLDEYIASDQDRQDQPVHGGIVVLHRLRD